MLPAQYTLNLPAASQYPRVFLSVISSGNELSTGDLWWQFLFYLAAVVFVVFLAWMATRFLARRGAEAQQSQSRYLNVLDRITLAPGRHLYLLSVAGKVLLIGQGEREFSLLMEISEEELVRYLEENPIGELDSAGMTFLKNLQDTLSRMRPRGS